MEPKHTPTPWIMKKGTGLGTTPHFVGETSDGKNTPFQALKEADAAYIARAVNMHEEMLNVLQWLINEREEGTDKGLLPDGLLNAARQAIKKAEGK